MAHSIARGALILAGSLSLAAPLSTLFAQAVADPTPAEVDYARGLSRVFQSVARRLEPSVVHITQLNRVTPVRRDFFGKPMAAGPSRMAPTGLGSGVIVTTDGYILTNNHVVRSADSLLVRLADGKEYPARTVGRDEETDIAVIKVDAQSLPAADFADSDSVQVGEWVVAIGSPFGFSSSVSAGIVSAKGRYSIPGLQEYQDFIQTDAVINPGNSGGPLISLDGRIVGINSAIASRTGGSEGIGFAIPSNVAKHAMQSLINAGRVSRGWLGVELAPEASASPGADRHVVVDRVVEGGPAALAGLRAGDIITAYQGRRVEDVNQLRAVIALTPPRTTVAIDLLRAGKPSSVRAEVGDKSRDGAAAVGAAYVENAGIAVRSMTPEISREIGFRESVPGVLVVDVEPGGRAAQAGLQVKDIICEINQSPVESAEQVSAALARATFADPGVRLSITRPAGPRVLQGYLVLRD